MKPKCEDGGGRTRVLKRVWPKQLIRLTCGQNSDVTLLRQPYEVSNLLGNDGVRHVIATNGYALLAVPRAWFRGSVTAANEHDAAHVVQTTNRFLVAAQGPVSCDLRRLREWCGTPCLDQYIICPGLIFGRCFDRCLVARYIELLPDGPCDLSISTDPASWEQAKPDHSLIVRTGDALALITAMIPLGEDMEFRP